MIFDGNELARAVFFYDDEGNISTEMNIAEFQAVLDGFVPLEHLAGVIHRACYIEFDYAFHVQRLVFFKFPVDSEGCVDRSWHVPLMDLASAASRNKDLGGGPVQLACYSNCPIAHMKGSLWDPDLSPASNQLVKIKKAIADNRLGVQFRVAQEVPRQQVTSQKISDIEQEISTRLRKEYAQEFRDHVAQLLKEQRLRLSASKNEFNEENKQTKIEYQQRISELQNLLSDKDRLLDDQRDLNQSLKNTVDGQVQKIEAMREYFDHKLSSMAEVDETSIEKLKESIEAEFTAKFESESKELKERLQMREVELLYRNEREVQMHDELVRIREEHQKVLSNTGDQLLTKLIESGISLVSYHPGAGHLTLPLNDVAKYIESPTEYVAEKCGVSKALYESWLLHFRMPVCNNVLEEGQVCGENVARIETPLDFNVGENDCCSECQKKKARSHLRIAGS